MKLRKNYLLSPGPTPVPEAVSLAGALPMIHHRTPQFQAVMKDCFDGLKILFQTENPVLFFASSGTGMMEAAIANLMSPGEEMIVAEAGKFGERWSEIGNVYGCKVIPIKIEYSRTVKPDVIAQTLSQHPNAKAVFIQLSETSTGCVHDVEAIAKVVNKTKTLLVVDGISGLGAEPCTPDAWGIDCILTGSQKGVMLPPGLGFISLSEKAWKRVDESKCPRYYFDLKKAKKSATTHDSPFTPAISLLFQLQEALKIIKDETMEGVWKRHTWMAQATRAGCQALNLELFAERPGNVLTAVKTPAGVDGEKLVKVMRDDLGVTIAGGQDQMKGQLFRIAHLGYMDRFDILTAIAALETALKRQGFNIKPGQGVAAAQEILWKDPT